MGRGTLCPLLSDGMPYRVLCPNDQKETDRSLIIHCVDTSLFLATNVLTHGFACLLSRYQSLPQASPATKSSITLVTQQRALTPTKFWEADAFAALASCRPQSTNPSPTMIILAGSAIVSYLNL